MAEGSTLNWTVNLLNISEPQTFKLPKPLEDPEEPSEGGS